ncbi:hypothetical protein ACQP2U_33060 [Nocardia sp. CA-084685]|uniref:hypothetical protein n=1 Tax=Nocardia sp. CA-084685 TaxID=3239970 RepID=UPI003D99343F
MLEEAADPTPAPSPGPAPTPPKPEHKGWQVPLDPPPRASKALADYIVEARDVFQDLADTLGTPEYAVSPPKGPPVALPLLAVAEAAGLVGFAAGSYSTSQNVLQGRQTVWHGADGTAVTIAQRAATVGSAALRQLQHLVYRLQEMSAATNLDQTVPASYTERPSASGGLASYAEYRLAVTVERTLKQAYAVVIHAQTELGLQEIPPLVPQFPAVPKGIVPPQPVPLPERQRHPQSPGTLEV